MSLIVYQLFLVIYRLGVAIVAPFNRKARLWMQGRVLWEMKWQKMVQDSGIASTDKVVWMHASSLGEFEQGRPVLEEIKRQNPEIKVVITFFSPSGYEVRKDYKGADVVGYLPIDGLYNAHRLVQIINPTMVLWVKYEYWFFTLQAIYRKGIPLLFVSGIFRNDQPFFAWYGALHRKMLKYFTHFFVQQQASADLLKGLVADEKITISGDTRFDSVYNLSQQWKPVELVEKWLDGAQKVVVAGSTWQSDEEEMAHYIRIHPEIKWVVAPHNIDGPALKETLETFTNPLCFSHLKNEMKHSAKIPNLLIIDNVGMLRYLYKYGTVCYVGGGFTGDGIHNVLEAAVYGKPVIHGPEYSKYYEAIGLNEAEGSFVIESGIELEKELDELLNSEDTCQKAGENARHFVENHTGATQTILGYIQEKRLFTSPKNR